MKNRDLSKVIGNIDLKYVEEAENYTAKRMTLTKVISLAACIAILVAAIPVALILNREDGKTNAPVVMPIDTEDQTDVKDPEDFKIIYCSSEEAQAFKEAFKNENVEIRENAESNFDLSAKVSDAVVGFEVPAKVYLTLKGKDFSFSLQETYETKLVNSIDEYLKSLGYEAIYCMDNNPAPHLGELILKYNYVTNQIVGLVFTHEPGFEIDSTLTEKEIEDMARNDLDELFGDVFLNQYTWYATSKCEAKGYGSYYLVEFLRYINGYPTNERLYISYNMKGELLDFGSNNLGSFKNFANDLDEESIMKADAEAVELLEGKNIKEKFLSVGIDGKVYVTIKYSLPGSPAHILKLHYEVS